MSTFNLDRNEDGTYFVMCSVEGCENFQNLHTSTLPHSEHELHDEAINRQLNRVLQGTYTHQSIADNNDYYLYEDGWFCDEHTHLCFDCSEHIHGTDQDALDAGFERNWSGGDQWACPEHYPRVASQEQWFNSSQHSVASQLTQSLNNDNSTPPVSDSEDNWEPDQFNEGDHHNRFYWTQRGYIWVENVVDGEGEWVLEASEDESEEESEEESGITPREQRLINRNRRRREIELEEERRIILEERRRILEETLLSQIMRAIDYDINLENADDSVKVMDFISLEETPISELLRDENNIIFQSDTAPFNAVVTTKQMIRNLVYMPDYLDHTKYKCVDQYDFLHFTEDNIIHDTDTPPGLGDKYKFINTRAIGLIGGLFLRNQLEGILESLRQDPNSSRYFIYHIHNDNSITPIISATNISWTTQPRTWTIEELPTWSPGLTEASIPPGNMVSSDHCANTIDNFLVTIKRLHPAHQFKRGEKKRKRSSNGAKKTKRKRGGKRKTRKKRKTRRKKRKKRKKKTRR